MSSKELTRAQAERLEMLAEEAAEISQMCMKILRHGYSSYHPSEESKPAHKRETNRKALSREMLEFWAIFERMALLGDLPTLNFWGSKAIWEKKLKWTHHQEPTI